jgi:hypothetical protein
VFALFGLAVAFVLIVAGVALIFWPAALVVAGLLVGAVALLADIDRKGNAP